MAIPQNKYHSGFTVSHMLVVMTIIVILATIALYNLEKSVARARDAERIANMKLFESALDVFYLEHGVYPCGASDFSGFGAATRDTSGSCPANRSDPDAPGFLNGDPMNNAINCTTNPNFGLMKDGLLPLNCYEDPLETPGSPPPAQDPKYTYAYYVSADRQKFLLATHLEENDSLMVNDGGRCHDTYEIGPSLGIVTPRWPGIPTPGGHPSCSF